MHITNWYTRKQKINHNLLWLGLNTYQEMYWSLSDDSSSPFSRISVANSSFSIDPTKWCPLNCSYCVTLSNNRDLNSEKLIKIEKNKNYKDLFSKNRQALQNVGETVGKVTTTMGQRLLSPSTRRYSERITTLRFRRTMTLSR